MPMAVPIPATGTESGSEFHLRPKEAQELLRGCFGQYRAKLVGLARTSLEMSADLFATASPAERAALIAAAAVDTATSGRHVLDGTVDFDDTLNTGLHAVQREHILRVLNATHWVIEGTSGAALKLGMKPATLRHRMKKLGISRAQNPQAN